MFKTVLKLLDCITQTKFLIKWRGNSDNHSATTPIPMNSKQSSSYSHMRLAPTASEALQAPMLNINPTPPPKVAHGMATQAVEAVC